MNIDEITVWGRRACFLLAQSKAGELSEAQRDDLPTALLEQKLGWVEDFATDLQDWSAMAKLGAHARQIMRVDGYHRDSSTDLDARLAVATTPLASQFREQLISRIAIEAAKAKPGESIAASSEVLESLIGKGKRLEGQQSRSGFTRSVLALAASVVEPSEANIRKALSAVRMKHLASWVSDFLPQSLQAKRRRDLRDDKMEQNQDKSVASAIPNF